MLEAGGKLIDVDLSHVRTGAGASGVIPLLPWDHMQGLVAVLEANLTTLRSLNLNGLRVGDVGLASLVDRILTKENCLIKTIDMRHNALTASGLRSAIIKLSVLNYTLCSWLLEESGSTADSSHSHSYTSNGGGFHSPLGSISEGSSFSPHSSSSSSLSPEKSRPGPSATLLAKREKEKEKEKEKGKEDANGGSNPSSTTGTLSSEPKEITYMTFSEIAGKYVAEFLKLNTDVNAAITGSQSHLCLKFMLRHPRLCPTRMAKLVGQLNQVTVFALENWTPPPPLTLKHQEKRLSKLSPDQIAFKELKRTVPGTLFASLPKLTELRLTKCARVDVERQKKGTLRGVFGKSKSSSPIVKTTFVPTLPPELGAMPSLRRLTMSECGLTEITPTVLPFMTGVEQIDFGMNDISVIPSQISFLTNVTRLFLNSNEITEIPSELSSMRYLRELWLYDNHITKVPPELAKWFPVLKDLRVLVQRVEEGLVMEDAELLELRRQEEDLIKSKSSIGAIGFLGLLKLSQASSITIYKAPTKKKK